MAAKRSYPIWFSIVWRVLASILVPALGAVYSIQHDDWTWFARSGSIMVALSVLYFSLAYSDDSLSSAYATYPLPGFHSVGKKGTQPSDRCLSGYCAALSQKGERTKCNVNTKLHAVTDTVGRPDPALHDRWPPLSAMHASPSGHWYSDYTGARALVSSLSAAD